MNYNLQRSKTTCLDLDNRLKLKGTTVYIERAKYIMIERPFGQDVGYTIRASPAGSSNFYTVWSLNNLFYLLPFTYLFFHIHFPTNSLSFSLSHLNIFLHSFFNISFSIFFHSSNFNEKCYILNILQYFHNKSYVVSYYLF